MSARTRCYSNDVLLLSASVIDDEEGSTRRNDVEDDVAVGCREQLVNVG